MQIKGDLHIHTTASDGEVSPGEIISIAKSKGLSTIAITDHDTLSGVDKAFEAGAIHEIHVIAGIEISVEYDPGTLHILGYFSDFPSCLEEALDNVQQARQQRIPKIIAKLNELGLDIGVEDVKNIAGDAQIGRPHIARALITKGYVKNFDDAFDLYLGKGKKAYVEKEKMTYSTAIHLIRQHKGLPVLAHPYTLGLEEHELTIFIQQLKEEGLMGIEIYYPDHTTVHKNLYESIALDLNLIITGGTDYHGPSQKNLSIGDFGVDKNTLDSIITCLNNTNRRS